MLHEKESLKDISIAAHRYNKERDYWLEKLSGELLPSRFPFDEPHNTEITETATGQIEFEVSPDLLARLRKLSNHYDYTLHMILTAAVTVLLARYSGNSDIIVGMPIYKQDSAAEFVNTLLALRVRVEGPMTFKELLLQVRQTVIEAGENQNYPLEALFYQLGLPFSREDRNPLFPVAVMLENIHNSSYLRHLRHDTIFCFHRQERSLSGVMEYHGWRCRAEIPRQVVRHFTRLLETLLHDVNAKLHTLDFLTDQEKQQLLEEFNDTRTAYALEKTLPQLFTEQVEKNPDRVAAAAREQPPGQRPAFITYQELNQRANRLAGYLRKKGLGPGTIAAIVEERTLDMAIMILAVLKAGGAYLPVNLTLPGKRVIAMLDDARSPLVLAKNRDLEKYIFTSLQGLRSSPLEPYRTLPRPTLQARELDSLLPDRTLVDYGKYNRYIGQCMAKNSIVLQATRGCPYHCAYCHKIFPHKHVHRSAESIFSEVKRNYDLGMRKFAFVDDIFNLNRVNSMRFFHLVIQAGLNVEFHFPGGLRGDLLTRDYIDLMAAAGVTSTALALETASPRLQKLVGKNLNLEKFRQNLEYLCETYPQMILELFTMHGFPGETEAEAMMTLEFVKSLHWVHFPYMNVLKIYPNTDMEKIALEHGIAHETIIKSENYAHYELSEICPFTRNFSYRYRSGFLNDYFLLKERLLHVLPYQMKVLAEDEILQKYNSYLPADTKIRTFDHLLEYLKISKAELGAATFAPEDSPAAYQANLETLKKERPEPDPDALRILLLDLSQFFSNESEFFYDITGVEPLGMMYLLTYLDKHLGTRLNGKIARSRVDFDHYDQLRRLLEEFKPEVIGIRTLNIYKDFFHKVISLIKQWGYGGPIIVGGPYPTTDTVPALQDKNIDLVVLSEGEETFYEVIQAILANRGKLPGEEVLKKIKGIAFIPAEEKARSRRLREIVMIDQLEKALEGESAKNPLEMNRAGDPAYVIFTSGTTGHPKGVIVGHRNVHHLVLGLEQRIYRYYEGGARVAQVAPYGFDASVKQIFAALLLGHTLCIVPEECRVDSEMLLHYYQTYRVDISDGTPAHIKFLLQSLEDYEKSTGKKLPATVTDFIIGGEALPVKIVADFLKGFGSQAPRVTNIYGLTECTVDTASYEITADTIRAHRSGEAFPIGKPMVNSWVLILDRDNRPQPVEVPGELCIGGDGLARGYLNNPELTAERFCLRRQGGRFLKKLPPLTPRKNLLLKDTEVNKKLLWGVQGGGFLEKSPPGRRRFYRTGDLARWLPEGNIQCLGRKDRQVKVRGYRIELEEIEARLQQYQGLTNTVAAVKEDADGEKYLCAYIVAAEPLKSGALREYLNKVLPDYMVPTHFVQLAKIPLTANGKVDRRALPEPVAGDDAAIYRAPRDRVENTLVKLWSGILKIEPETIGIDSDFFQLGGHSLRATILISRIHKTFAVHLPLQELFKTPTIRATAAYIKNNRQEEFSLIPPEEEKEYYPLSSSQKRVYVVQQMDPATATYTTMLPVFLEGDLDIARIRAAFSGLIRRHDSLRSSFRVIDGEPVQVIAPGEGVWDLEEYRMPEEEALRYVREAFIKPFDLSKAPLLRAAVIILEPKRCILAVSLHHINADGSSVVILLNEFTQLYKGEHLPSPRLRYIDYCRWQNSPGQREIVKKQESYWLKQFENGEPQLNLPIDYPRQAIRGFAGSHSEFHLEADRTRAINPLIAREEVTLYMFLLAVFNVFLFKITGQEDIVVGTPIANRRHADLEAVVGMFANILVMRNFPLKNRSFADFLQEVKKRTIEAYANQDYKMDDLMDRVMTRKDLSRNSLFDVAFSLQNMERYEIDMGELRMAAVDYSAWSSRCDMTFVAFTPDPEPGAQIQVAVEYSTGLFKPGTIRLFIEIFKQVIESVSRDPGILLQDLEVREITGPIQREPAVSGPGQQPERAGTPLETEIQQRLLNLCRDVLETEILDSGDNFFDRGGHSLKAMVLAAKIQKEFQVEFPLSAVFKHRSVREMAEYLRGAGKSKYEGIAAVEKQEYYPLSSAQKRLYFLQQMNPASTGYNIPLILPLGENPETEKLETAINKLIARHEILRTSFISITGNPVQRIHKIQDPGSTNKTIKPFDQTFSNVWPPAGPPEAIDITKPFDLARAPLLRVELASSPPSAHLLIIDIHHIVTDGTSQGILSSDFISLYNGETLKPLRLHYKDFSQWQNRLVKSGIIKNQEEYWRAQLSGEIPRLRMPTDFRRPLVFTFAGAHCTFGLDPQDARKFKRLAGSNGGTLYMNLLAVMNVIFYKYTGQEDILIGTGIAGRPHADTQPIIGMFVNMLVMRNYPQGEKRYEPFLKEVITSSLWAFENQDLQFEELVEKLEVERDPSRNPLFDISMVVQNYRRSVAEIPGEAGISSDNDNDKTLLQNAIGNSTSKFDMTFFVVEDGDEIRIDIEYYTGIYKAESIQRLAGHFKQAVHAVVGNPFSCLKDIDIIPGEEKRQILYTFSGKAGELPGEKTLQGLYEEQAARTPHHLALVSTRALVERQETYEELNRRAREIAGYLRDRNGRGEEKPVGLLLSRGDFCAAGILGALKAGYFYVPLDPLHPRERLRRIIADAGIAVILSEKRYVNVLNRLQWEIPVFHTSLYLDTYAVWDEEEVEKNPAMARELWDHVGETAGDEIAGGGWKSSYTGEPFTTAEMEEYGSNILQKLEPLLHPGLRVLEIGCASGISMYRLAPRVGFYYGTDLSGVMIEKNKQEVKQKKHGNITLSCIPALDIDKLGVTGIDLVIMNSVIQCFHGHNYLRRVILKALGLMGETGYLFIGDVMDLEKRAALIRELTAFKYAEVNREKGYKTKTDFSAELFLPRAYWEDLGAEIKEIAAVEISDKIYTIENELTRYRYDVLITVNKSSVGVMKPGRQKNRDDLTAIAGVRAREIFPAGRSARLAYIIYTSGSTGEPRGVEVEHRGVVNMLLQRREIYAMGSGDVNLQLFSYAFDGYVTGFFTPLLSGSRLILPGREETGDVDRAAKLIVKHGVTHFIAVPSLYAVLLGMLTPRQAASLKTVTLAGENLQPGIPEMTAAKSDTLEIVNEYGVTESSVLSTSHRHQERDVTVSIGTPLPNIYIHILGKHLEIQPLGAAGELYIAGLGTARGYLNNPELTAEKFLVKNFCGGSRGAVFSKSAPLAAGGKIYKTGDLARWYADGRIEFLGRRDHQVKIHGLRIELGEIEARLAAHPRVRNAVVLQREDSPGSKYLIAYVEPGKDGLQGDLKEFLSQSLPYYMIPAHIVLLERLPLTAAGKVDRKALPQPGAAVSREAPEPRSRVEKKLVEVWSAVLGKRVGIKDNFFDLGGDSIKAIQVSARLRQHDLDLSLADLFLHPVIGELAGNLKEIKRGISQEAVAGAVPLTPIQCWFFQSDFTQAHHFNQAVMLYRREGFEEEKVSLLLTKLSEHHDALRMVFYREVKKGAAGTVQVIQENRGPGGRLFDMEVFSYGGNDETRVEKEIRDRVGLMQTGIDLETGPLVKVGLFKTPSGDHLLIAVHHLVIDGISWRILLEDLSRGYENLDRGKEVVFPPKTHSFKSWAEKLREYANWLGESREEFTYWQEVGIRAAAVKPLPCDHEIPPALEKRKNLETLTIELDEAETINLLEKVNRAYRTEINDILLTGLGLALREWTGSEELLLQLEGHGREPIIAGIDTSRTVGWFTTQYPVVLVMDRPQDLAYSIKSVKEHLRRVPHKGIGWGIWKYLVPPAKKEGLEQSLEPGTNFNYLGQFDRWQGESSGAGHGEGGHLRLSHLDPGESFSPEMEQSQRLGISGLTAGGRLALSISYNRYAYDGTTIRHLIDSYKTHLLAILRHCREKPETESTPSDVTDLRCLDISLEKFSRITGQIKANIPGAAVKYIYSLSPMQRGMLYHALPGGEQDVYFIQHLLQLEGNLEPSLLEASFNKLIERYDIFRTLFLYEGLDVPVQVVLHRGQVETRYEDIGTMPETHRTIYLEDYRKKDKQRGFNLGKEIPMRYCLFRDGKNSYYLLWSYHHILMDGWCTGIIFRELVQIHERLRQGQALDLAEVTPYKNYIAWLETRDKAAGLRCWESYLAGYDRQALIPGPGTRPDAGKPGKEDNDQVEKYILDISRDESNRLNRLAGLNQVTLNTVIQALWGLLLQKYNNAADVVFGAVVSGRPPGIEGIEKMVGLFINTVPVRIVSGADQPFSQLLTAIQQAGAVSRAYEFIPLAEIQSVSTLKRDLLNHIMSFENYPLHEDERISGEIRVKAGKLYDRTNYPFNIVINPGDPLEIKFMVTPRVYARETVASIGRHFKQLLRQVIREPSLRIKSLDILTETEREQILFEINGTAADYPRHLTLAGLFARQAEQAPGQVALWAGTANGSGLQVSYGELNERAGAIAHLLQEKAPGPDTIVGIMAAPSLEMITGILGILKAGAAYLPIDPQYPRDRIDYMLNDSGAKILVTAGNPANEAEKTGRWEGKIYNIEECLCSSYPLNFSPSYLQYSSKLCSGHRPPATSLAYVIYTSGTTGKPKGVMIQQRNVVQLLFNERNPFHFTARDVWTLFHSFCFDFSVWEMYGALLNGGKLLVPDREVTRDPNRYLALLKREQVTVLNQTPAAFYNLADRELDAPGKELHLRCIIFGGEALTPARLKGWQEKYPQSLLVNMFGITETTVHTTYKEIGPSEIQSNSGSIGNPLPTLTVYLLDRWKKPVPPGVPGECWVGGAGVARGYLNRPALTAEKFSYDKTRGKKERFYQSGDQVRSLPGGEIEYLGRIDRQVKIRGYRIEPGEIELRLCGHNAVKEAAVSNRGSETGENRLYAFIVPTGTQWRPGELKTYLAQFLPNYMIPAYFIRVDRIPLTPNGKVDRQALHQQAAAATGAAVDYAAPQNQLESQIAALWQDLLKCGRVGRNDNFFDLGGNSLNIIQVTGRAKTELGLEIPVVKIFENPTVESLAQYLLERHRPAKEETTIKIRNPEPAAQETAKKTRLKQRTVRKR